VNEFDLIDTITRTLGPVASGGRVRVGPGDDAAVVAAPSDSDVVSSIDALVGGVHFPLDAAPWLIGYRALMVSASDLAAMGAADGWVIVALNLPDDRPAWVQALTAGMRQAAEDVGVRIVGGNLARGPLAIAVSVHGFVPANAALLRSGARPGDEIWVTGPLGGAAAALARGGLAGFGGPEALDPLARRYFMPVARIDAGLALRGAASAAIDVSDGLLQDLAHLCAASAEAASAPVGAALQADQIPLCPGATLAQALGGGDDYELCFTTRHGLPPGLSAQRIGRIVATAGIEVDGRPVHPTGYQHFA
jgi:thiamine-monophosphate kinase